MSGIPVAEKMEILQILSSIRRFSAENVTPSGHDGSMALVLNFDGDDGPSRTQADAAMSVVIDHLSRLQARLAVPLMGRYRGQLDAAEARSLATVIHIDGNTKVAESIAAKGGKTSKASRRRSAKRASAVKANSAIADKMEQGDLSGEQVELLADAADKTQGASLTDDTLIDKVAAVDPDKGKSVIDDHVADTSSSGKEQSRHDKQRRQRRASRFRTKDGCEAITFAGDRETIDEIWAFVKQRSNAFFQRDGGRGVPSANHPRSHDQRMFDAAASYFASTTRSAATNSRETSNQPDCDPSGTAARPTTSKRYTPKLTSSRPVIVVGVTLEKLTGLDHDQAAQVIGSGPIADSVLAQYLDADPDIIGLIFGHDGQPLWLGRQTRLASLGQIIGLIVRDKGCVLCSAHHSKCQAHHLMPWTSSGRGNTNINELALVCEDCHRRLHDDEQTLHKDRHTSKWKLRPALPHELPAKRTPRPSDGQAPLLT